METPTLVTMIVVTTIVWGGFLGLVATAFRKEKVKRSTDRPR